MKRKSSALKPPQSPRLLPNRTRQFFGEILSASRQIPNPAEQREHVGTAAGIGGELLADLAHARVLDRGGGAHRFGELTGGADAFQPLSELLQSCHQSASANAVSAAWSAALVSSSSFLPVLSVSVRAGSFVMNHEKSWDEKSLRSSASTLSA